MQYTLDSLADQRNAIINALLIEKTITDARLNILADCLKTTDSMICELLECIVPYQAGIEQDSNIELEEESDENEHDA